MTADEELRRALHVKADLLSRDDDRTFTHQMVRLYEVHQIIDEAIAARSEPPVAALTRSEPRAEELRQALLNHAYGAHGMTEQEADAWVSTLVAATPPAEGLDVAETCFTLGCYVNRTPDGYNGGLGGTLPAEGLDVERPFRADLLAQCLAAESFPWGDDPPFYLAIAIRLRDRYAALAPEQPYDAFPEFAPEPPE